MRVNPNMIPFRSIGNGKYAPDYDGACVGERPTAVRDDAIRKPADNAGTSSIVKRDAARNERAESARAARGNRPSVGHDVGCGIHGSDPVCILAGNRNRVGLRDRVVARRRCRLTTSTVFLRKVWARSMTC